MNRSKHKADIIILIYATNVLPSTFSSPHAIHNKLISTISSTLANSSTAWLRSFIVSAVLYKIPLIKTVFKTFLKPDNATTEPNLIVKRISIKEQTGTDTIGAEVPWATTADEHLSAESKNDNEIAGTESVEDEPWVEFPVAGLCAQVRGDEDWAG